MPSLIPLRRFRWVEHQAKRGRYPNARRLAEEFEISEKTARRNIIYMRDQLNAPLVFDRARNGYYYSDHTFSLSEVHLSAHDLASLLLARDLLKNIAGQTIAQDVAAAADKIAAAMEKHGTDIGNVDNIVSLRFVEQSRVNDQVFKCLLHACIDKHSVAFRYSSPARNEPTQRTVDPYHLYNYMGNWQLVGWCHLRQQYRNFNLLRINSIEPLQQVFAVRNDFTPEHYFSSSFGIFKAWKTQRVTLQFTPEKARWVTGQIWHPSQKETLRKDGSLELTFPVAAYPELLMEILKHGAGVKVIRPPELKKLVRAEADKIARLY
ncbi:MAG TPA: WYL domain-containing protein [Dissulfurispiraceae bacterium]|nr:WYL domain-containing protein [Dissulfurispiraceae bacterium]